MSWGWIGVDLDGTLAHYDRHQGASFIGCPVDAMVERVLEWLKEGTEVRIFTARAGDPESVLAIQEWCQKHLGQVLSVTNEKDFGMIELYDDRCRQVEPNTGRLAEFPI